MKKEYRELLSRIAHELKPDELETMKFLCTDFMRYVKSTQMEASSTNCLMEVFEFFCNIEAHGKLGIDDLDRLKDMLKHLKREELVEEVVKFQFQRSVFLSSLGASELESGDSNRTTRNEQGIEEEEEEQPQEGQKTQSEEENREGQQAVDQTSRGTMVMQCAPYVAGAVWIAGSIYILNLYKKDPKALVNMVAKVVVPTGTLIKTIFPGSINFLLQATDLNSLKELWKRYKTGQLKEKLEQVMVTEELKNLANGEQIEFVVTISEAEYRNACLDLMVAKSQAQTLCKKIISSSPTLQASRSLPDLTSLDATHDLSRVMHFGELELNSTRMKKKSIHASAGKRPSNLLCRETVICLLQFINSIKSKIKFFPGFDLFVPPLSGAMFGLHAFEEKYIYYHHSLIDNPHYKLLLNLLQEVNAFLDGRNVLILPEKAIKDLFFFVSRLKNVKLDEINWIELEFAMKRMAFDYPSRLGKRRSFSKTETRENLNNLTKEMKELAAFLVKEFHLDSRLLKDTQDEIGSLESPKMSSSGDDDDDDDDALRRKLQSLRSDTEKLVAEKTKDLEASKMGKGQRRIVSPTTTGKTST